MSIDKKIPLAECTSCNNIAIPPQYVCRKCGGSQTREVLKSLPGTIYTHTTIRIAPEAYKDQAPYDIAIVELAPGLRVTARIMPDSNNRGMEVGQPVVFDHIDEWGYWFSMT